MTMCEACDTSFVKDVCVATVHDIVLMICFQCISAMFDRCCMCCHFH
jgi:hypothetical protein